MKRSFVLNERGVGDEWKECSTRYPSPIFYTVVFDFLAV